MIQILKKLIGLFMMLLIVVNLSACAGNDKEKQPQPAQVKKYENQNETPVGGGTLKLCLYETDTLNPLLTKNEQNIKVLKLMYDGLFRVYQDFSVTPDLCESYTISGDGLVYTFQLKNDVTFHSGERLIARDVEYSMNLILLSDGYYKPILSNVKSVSSKNMTLTVILHKPTANLPALLDFPILRESGAVQAAIKNSASYVPNGTGLYKLQSYKMSKELHLSKNENYHAATAPYIGNIAIYMVKDRMTAISMLENLGVDLLPSTVINLSEYTPKRNVNSVEYNTNQFTFVGINNQNPALLTPFTKNAISFVIDRETILKTALNSRGVAADIPIHPSSWLYDKEQSSYSYNIMHAKELLGMDGWSDTNQDGVLDKIINDAKIDLKLDILINEENSSRMKIALIIKAGLEEVGISTTITSLSYNKYMARIQSLNYDLYIGEIQLSQNQDLTSLLMSGRNMFGLTNTELDEYLALASLVYDDNERKEIYRNICTNLKSNMPIIGLYFKNESLIFDNKLKGNIMPSASDIFVNIQDWFLK